MLKVFQREVCFKVTIFTNVRLNCVLFVVIFSESVVLEEKSQVSLEGAPFAKISLDGGVFAVETFFVAHNATENRSKCRN